MNGESKSREDVKLQEKLKRQLTGTKADFDTQDVKAYFAQIVAPIVNAAGIHQLSVLLWLRTGEVITTELQEGYLGDRERYVRLVESISSIGCSYFLLKSGYDIIAGYSENDLDWVVLKYEEKASTFLEPIIDAFWSPFFDLA